jgi:chromosome segregation ATPase
VLYVIFASLVAAAILAFIGFRELRWRQRERTLRDLLDGADALEAKLQQCRVRMQRLRDMLTILPEEMSAEADSALRADTKVQAALKDLLAHRLWIQQHATDATQQQLDAARSALAQSSTTLGSQLDRLAAIAADLERAQSSARTVIPRQSS